jgi:MFS family permease
VTATLETQHPGTRRIHRAWFVAAVTMGALIAAAGFRSSTGALLEPLEHEFGWSRATTSGAVSLNLVVYGLTAPFAAALMERFGVRRVVAASLSLVALGAGLTLLMTSAWQLWLLWGFAVGIGTGALALVFGAIVANRWFVRHRGVVIGVFSAASSTGQLVFLPAIAHLAEGPGWRWAAGLVTALALALVPLVWWILRDQPTDVGTTPYGAGPGWVPAPVAETRGAARVALETLRESARSRTFWILFATFWICGWSTNGLSSTSSAPSPAAG